MKKISINISGHSTSFSIEDEFADALKKLADANGKTIAALVREIDSARAADSNLSSATRVWILKQVMNKS